MEIIKIVDDYNSELLYLALIKEGSYDKLKNMIKEYKEKNEDYYTYYDLYNLLCEQEEVEEIIYYTDISTLYF